MGLAWLSQPAKQFHGRCSHWQSTSRPQPQRKGQNFCKHASITHPQHALVHAIRESHSRLALLLVQLIHSSCSTVFNANKLFKVLGVLGSVVLKSNVMQRLLLSSQDTSCCQFHTFREHAVFVIHAGQSWQQNPGRTQAKAACA